MRYTEMIEFATKDISFEERMIAHNERRLARIAEELVLSRQEDREFKQYVIEQGINLTDVLVPHYIGRETRRLLNERRRLQAENKRSAARIEKNKRDIEKWNREFDKWYNTVEETHDEVLTYIDFKELAIKYYNEGGDAYCECWDENDYDEYVDEFGPITKHDALDMFGVMYSVEEDGFAAAQYFGGAQTADEPSEAQEEDIPDYPEDYGYIPSATAGDYGPNNPWDAPGMKVRDFIR